MRDPDTCDSAVQVVVRDAAEGNSNTINTATTQTQSNTTSGNSGGWKSDYDAYFMNVLLKRELDRIRINLTSPQLKYRGYLILRLKSVTKSLLLGNSILHTAVRLLDNFMDAHDISIERILSVAFACLFIAVKFDMEGNNVPRFSEICKVGQLEPLPRNTLLELEFKILDYVNWDLCTPTVATFLSFFSRFMISYNEYLDWKCETRRMFNEYEDLVTDMRRKLSQYLALTLSDVHLMLHPPSLVAAGCLLATRQHFGLNYMPKQLGYLNCTYSQIDTMALRLNNMLRNQANSTGHKRVYSDSSEAAWDDDDQGYSTGKSSTEGSAKKCHRAS